MYQETLGILVFWDSLGKLNRSGRFF
jgi:hypothetical protein